METEDTKTTYASAGVDIKREERTVESIVSVIKDTFKFRAGRQGEVKSEIGHFANFVEAGNKYLVFWFTGNKIEIPLPASFPEGL